MNKLNIKYINIEDLIPYSNNPRRNDIAVDMVAKSIEEFGFKNPIIIDENNVIIAGHTRLKAAEKLGIIEVPIIMASDLTPEQVKAFRIADNKTHEFSEWDEDLLKLELEGIDGFTGFDIDEIEELNFENIGYKEKEEKGNPPTMKIVFEKEQDFKSMEDDIRKLINEKYERVKVSILCGEL